MMSDTHTNLPVNAIVRLSHAYSADSQGQGKLLALFADNQSPNCDTESSNHLPSLSILTSK